jgi:hypothetical protein
MSPKKPRKEDTDIGRLEIQIENLRCAFNILIIIVSLLSGYMILQLIQQYSLDYFIPLGLFLVAVLVILLLGAYAFATDKG